MNRIQNEFSLPPSGVTSELHLSVAWRTFTVVTSRRCGWIHLFRGVARDGSRINRRLAVGMTRWTVSRFWVRLLAAGFVGFFSPSFYFLLYRSGRVLLPTFYSEKDFFHHAKISCRVLAAVASERYLNDALALCSLIKPVNVFDWNEPNWKYWSHDSVCLWDTKIVGLNLNIYIDPLY